MDFKWIGFLIEWILNGLDHRKNGLDHKNWIFCLPLEPRRLGAVSLYRWDWESRWVDSGQGLA